MDNIGHAILQQHARDAFRRKPIANLRPLEVDRKHLITAAGKNNNCGASIASRWRVDRHRGLRDIADSDQRPAGNKVLRIRS
jgi:hypothetical protein